MNYKVMKRPMFKMGGKANSQGTGITSGLDEKVNLAIGGGVIKGDNVGMRENFQEPKLDMGSMSLRELLDMQQANQAKRLEGVDTMRDLVRLQAIGNLAGNVLPNIESGGLRAVTDFFKDPMTTQTAIQGLTGLKKVDLQEGKIRGEGLDKYIKGRMGLEQLDIARNKAAVLTATQVRVNSGNQAREILRNAGVSSPNDLTDPLLRDQYEELKNIADGTLTSGQKRKIATGIATDLLSKYAAEQGLNIQSVLEKDLEATIQSVMKGLTGGNAYGGMPNRVERQMGSPMGGEQPLPEDPTKPVNPFQPKPIGPFPSKAEKMDTDMETKSEGNNVYAMLRSRLPQEITDDVVKLIAYNKEAFADFASIKNQEDVNSFNEKYGVELVIDVATF